MSNIKFILDYVKAHKKIGSDIEDKINSKLELAYKELATNDRKPLIDKLEKIKSKAPKCDHGGKCKHDPCIYRLAVEIQNSLRDL